jgi:hypothetical protein
MVLVLRLVFHLALRQAEAFAGSVLRLLGLDASGAAPDLLIGSALVHRGRRRARRLPETQTLANGPSRWHRQRQLSERSAFICGAIILDPPRGPSPAVARPHAT